MSAVADADVPLTAKFHILSYHEHQLSQLQAPDGSIVNQTVLVTSPAAAVTVLGVRPTGDDQGSVMAEVVIVEPAMRNSEGIVVPMGELLELKAQHDEAKRVRELLTNGSEGGDE